MTRGYTTIEQSEKLLSLGLDPNTADMCWCKEADGCDYIYSRSTAPSEERFAWSLAALLEIIPEDNNLEHDWEGWYITYKNHSTEDHNAPIDAAFEIICWLIEQGHIKVNK